MPKEYYIRSDLYNAFMPLFVGSERCAAGKFYGPAVRWYWLLHYILAGKGTYQVQGKEFSLHAGQAFLIKPDEITLYRADSEEPWQYAWVAFQSDKTALQELPYVVEDEGLQGIFEEVIVGQPIGSAAAAAKVWQVIDRLCPPETLSDDKGYVATAKSIVHKRYMQDINVSVLADSLGLDRSYFSGLFKRETGQSPGQYLLHYRMERAKELLKAGYSVTVVATSVGYGDLFTFSRSFKKYFGLSPSQLQKNQTVY